MDIEALKVELAGEHPVTGHYDADNAVAADKLNAVNCSRNKSSMMGSEVLNALDKAEFLALTDANKQKVWDVLHLGDINPFGVEADIFVAVFGGDSASIIALQAARKDDVSRAVELGLGFVFPGHVENARY